MCPGLGMVFHAEQTVLAVVVRCLVWMKHRILGGENGRALGSDM